MTTKNRKRTVYFTVIINITLIFISSVIFENGINTMIQFMCISVLVFTFLGTIMPLFDRFWDVIANFFYILAVSLPIVVTIYGGTSLFQLMILDQQEIVTVYLMDFSIVVYGCFGIAVVLLGRTHRMYPFWSKTKDGGKKRPGKNSLGLQKIQGFAGYNNK